MFISDNLNIMRSLPAGGGEELTLYEGGTEVITSDVAEMIDTVYADNAYFLSSLESSL